MSRTKKPQLVETYEHRVYGKIDLFLNRNNMSFEAEIAGEYLTYSSIGELRLAVQAACDGLTNLDWKPIILIQRNRDHFHSYESGNTVGFRFERFYVAKAPDDSYRKSDWDLPFHEKDRSMTCSVWLGWRREDGEFTPPCNPFDGYGTRRPDRNAIYLPYDEATWHALETLNALLLTLRGKLADLLYIPENAVQLAERIQGIKLLGA